MGILDKLKISKEELISGIVLAIVIAFVLPPVGLMLLLAFFGLLVVGLIISIFGSKNITNLLIAWLATRSTERISDKFSPRKNPHNPHVKTNFIDPLSLSPRGV